MVSAPTLNRLTVQQSVERYLRMVRRAVAGHSLAATTAANYERDLAEFVELAEKYHDVGVILDDLTAEDVDNIVIEYGSKPDGRHRPKPGKVIKTRGPGAQARFRQSVARLFSEAVLEGWVEASPIPRTRVPAPHQRPQGRCTQSPPRVIRRRPARRRGCRSRAPPHLARTPHEAPRHPTHGRTHQANDWSGQFDPPLKGQACGCGPGWLSGCTPRRVRCG